MSGMYDPEPVLRRRFAKLEARRGWLAERRRTGKHRFKPTAFETAWRDIEMDISRLRQRLGAGAAARL
jgi:hypothetical protein